MIAESEMREDDERTGAELCDRLTSEGRALSESMVLRCRTSLGRTCHRSIYCQLIQEVNKEKRLAWAKEHLHDDFRDVIWTDETTVQLESHRRFACTKKGEAPHPKPT